MAYKTEYTPKKFKLSSAVQRHTVKAIKESDITLITGPAGSGKTLLSIWSGIQLLNDVNNPIEKIIVIRLAVETCGEKIGALPGCQPYHSKILTPTGWVNMGSLNIGDFVIAADGSKTKILNIFKKGTKAVYRVTTTNGKSTECCEDHIWLTQTAEERKRGNPGKLRSTKEIINTLNKSKTHGKHKSLVNHFLPSNGIVQYEDSDLLLPPYTLGAFLGNGYLGHSISLTTIDRDCADRVNVELSSLDYELHQTPNNIVYSVRSKTKKPNKVSSRPTLINQTGNKIIYSTLSEAANILNVCDKKLQYLCSNNKTYEGIQYFYTDPCVEHTNTVKQIILDLGLLNKKAVDKFIPKSYLYTSYQKRLSLLRGLMDTDGTVKKSTGEAVYTTVSKELAYNIQELVRSLGGTCTVYTRDRRATKTKIKSNYISYELYINIPDNPFYIERKAKLYKPRKLKHLEGIKSIEYLYDKEVQCLLIDHPEHLYITDDFIVTHNTLDEKLNHLLGPLHDNLLLFMNEGEINYLIEKKKIEVVPVSHLRGRSLNNCFIIVEECQNLNFSMVLTTLTRLGNNSKMVLSGDTLQADVPGACGISVARTLLQDIEGVSFAHMTNKDIQRNPLIGKILERAELHFNIPVDPAVESRVFCFREDRPFDSVA